MDRRDMDRQVQVRNSIRLIRLSEVLLLSGTLPGGACDDRVALVSRCVNSDDAHQSGGLAGANGLGMSLGRHPPVRLPSVREVQQGCPVLVREDAADP